MSGNKVAIIPTRIPRFEAWFKPECEKAGLTRLAECRNEPGNGGVRIRFDRRDDAWRALVSAVAGESHVETTLDGYVRDQNEVERHVLMRVVVGRMQRSDRVLIALHPVGHDAGKGITLRLDRDDARAFSWAMAANDAGRRRMLVFDAQRLRIDAHALAAVTEHSHGR